MRRALRAEPSEDEFIFAKNPLTERPRRRLRYAVPIDVLNIAAAVTDEVVMPHVFRIESRGAALDGHFTHQTRLHQVPQIVISCSPRRARIQPIHALENFRSRRMPGAFHQKGQDRVALRSAPQSAAIQRPLNRFNVYQGIRIYLI